MDEYHVVHTIWFIDRWITFLHNFLISTTTYPHDELLINLQVTFPSDDPIIMNGTVTYDLTGE